MPFYKYLDDKTIQGTLVRVFAILIVIATRRVVTVTVISATRCYFTLYQLSHVLQPGAGAGGDGDAMLLFVRIL